MKTLFVLVFSLGLFGLLGYSLYLPAAEMYFQNQTLFISSTTATAQSQLYHTLVFALAGALGATVLQRIFAATSLVKALVSSVGLALSNMLVLMTILQIKSQFFEPLNSAHASLVPLSDFSVYGWLILSTFIAIVLTGAVNLFPRKPPVWYW